MNLRERHDQALERLRGAREALLEPIELEALSFIGAGDWEGLARWAAGRKRTTEARGHGEVSDGQRRG